MTDIRIPGKLILLGEYAVLHGADSLVAAIDRQAVISIDPLSGESWQLSSSLCTDLIKFQVRESGEIEIVDILSPGVLNQMRYSFSALNDICRDIIKSGYSVQPFHIHINTDQFFLSKDHQKLGLGSSAAVIVGVVKAVTGLLQIEKRLFPELSDLFKYTHQLHAKVQGNRGSGIDVAASVFGGLGIYNLSRINEPEKQFFGYESWPAEELYIYPVWTGRSASTENMLNLVETFQNSAKGEWKKFINTLIDLANNGCVYFKNGKIQSFIEIIREYNALLKRFTNISKIPIISERHDRIAGIVHNSGGVYKPSGAGDGDFGVAFTDSEDSLLNIKQNLTEAGFKKIPLELCIAQN